MKIKLSGLLLAVLLTMSGLTRAAPPPAPDKPVTAAADDAAMGLKLQQALRVHADDVYGCYKAEQGASAKAEGEILLRLWIEPSGQVMRADVLKNQHGSATLASCLTDSMRNWKLPELAGDDVRQVVFPLDFRPTLSEPEITKAVVVPAGTKTDLLPGARIKARPLIEKSLIPTAQLSLTRLDLQPSARLALHNHPKSLEILYIIHGFARVRGAAHGSLVTAASGDLIVLPAGLNHSIEAGPRGPLQLVQIFDPAGPELAYLDKTRRDGTLAGVAATAKDAPMPRIIAAATLRPPTVSSDGKRSEIKLIDEPGVLPKLSQVTLDPAGELPAQQYDTEELIYVIDGNGVLLTDATRYPLAAGSAIYLPTHKLHQVIASSRMTAITVFASHN